ncbi:MAG: recombinase RecT [Lentisphaerae bacterium]|nr:recombinase RecT [Lentisphaerota bacterium]
MSKKKDEALPAKQNGGALSKLEETFISTKDKFLAVLPKQVDKERFFQVLLSMSRTPEIKACDIRSVLLAAYECSKLGLVPDRTLGHVYLVPFKDNKANCTVATVIVGYRGLIELARRSGMVGAVRSELVYENDEFDYIGGTKVSIRHRPWWLVKAKDSGEKIAGYCVAELHDGSQLVHVMPYCDIESAKGRSKARKSGPWVTDPEAMERKTVVRRASKMWPQSPDLARAVALDEEAERGEQRIESDDKLFGNSVTLQPGSFGFGANGTAEKPSDEPSDAPEPPDYGPGQQGSEEEPEPPAAAEEPTAEPVVELVCPDCGGELTSEKCSPGYVKCVACEKYHEEDELRGE